MPIHPESRYLSRFDPPLLRAREVAERLSVSEPTVWRLARAGELQRVRLGHCTRFRAADVEALIEKGQGQHASVLNDEDPAGVPGLVQEPARQGRHEKR